MANRRAVAKAIKASQQAQQLGTPSPLIQSYDTWSFGRGYGQLPRDPQEFLASAFGPLTPITPAPVDQPQDNGLAEPRRWQYPVGWNMPIGQPGNEGLKLTTFDNLRMLAEAYSVARACIQVRGAEIRGLGWDIAPTKEAAKAMTGDTAAAKDFAVRREEAMAFFRRPDPDYNDFSTWFAACMEEVLVTDALSIYLHPTRVKGKGLLGTDVAALELIDGSSIRPLLDVRGAKPSAPNPAYQQYLFGVPRTDLTGVISGEDIADLGPAAKEYTSQQLLYLPYTKRVWTPYGFPSMERCLIPAMAGLQRQKYQLDFFDESTIPGVFIAAGDPNATPAQLRDLQDSLNAMAGDPSWKHKIMVLPGGSRIDAMRTADLADQFDEVVMNQVTMAFDVMPNELGISPKVALVQSAGSSNPAAKASADINQRKGLKPQLLWFKSSVFDYILQRVCGQADMEFVFEGLEYGEDEQGLTTMMLQQVGSGLRSIDEGRTELQLPPWGLPITSEPVIVSQSAGTVTPLSQIDVSTGRPQGLPLPGAQPKPDGETPPEDATSPGEPKPPTGGSSGGTPAHEAAEAAQGQAQAEATEDQGGASAPSTGKAQAALAELDLLRRRLAKGRSIDGWSPRDLPAFVMAGVVADSHTFAVDVTITKAKQRLQGLAHVDRREQVVQHVENQVAAKLGGLVSKLHNGIISTPQFVDGGKAALRQGVVDSLKFGARHALTDRKQPVNLVKAPTVKLKSEDTPLDVFLGGLADREADSQEQFLTGLLKDVTAATGTDTSFDSRLDTYAQSAGSSYEEGYGLTGLATMDDPTTETITWHNSSADPCDNCLDLNDQQFTSDSLPGWPGDGTYGQDTLCLGAPRCHCFLTYSGDDGDSTAPINPLLNTDVADTDTELNAAQRQRQQDVQDARQAFVDSLPTEPNPALADTSVQSRAEARDAARSQLATEQGVLPQDVPAKDVASQLEAQGIPTGRSQRGG